MCERQKRERERKAIIQRGRGEGDPAEFFYCKRTFSLGFEISEIFFGAGSACVGFF